MMMDDMTIAIWLTIPPERMQELCPGKLAISANQAISYKILWFSYWIYWNT